MNSTATRPYAEIRSSAAPRAYSVRFLYPAFAGLLFVLMLLGFRQFYLHGRAVSGRELLPAVRNLLIVHGVVMTTWMTLFLVQPLLIAGRQRRLHMALGTVGAVLAAGIVVLGVWTAIATTAAIQPDLVRYGLHRRQFMAVPLGDMVAFAAFVAIGVRYRQRPEIHRPMMLLATLALMAAVTNRIPELRNFAAAYWLGHVFGPNLVPLSIGALFLATKTALTRSFDRWFAGGLAARAVISALTMQIAPTATWERIASFLTGGS